MLQLNELELEKQSLEKIENVDADVSTGDVEIKDDLGAHPLPMSLLKAILLITTCTLAMVVNVCPLSRSLLQPSSRLV